MTPPDTKLEGAFKRIYQRLEKDYNKKHHVPTRRNTYTGKNAHEERDAQGRLLRCRRGHEMVEENIIYGKQKVNGREYTKRTCKTCHREGERRRYAARVARAEASVIGQDVVYPHVSTNRPTGGS